MSKELKNRTALRPYQRRWATDPARFAFAVKSAQAGFSTATAVWAVERCLRIPSRTVTFLSRSEPQSKELAEKAKAWVDGYRGVAADYFPAERVVLESVEALQHRLQFPNGSRIIVLAANPDTARGYTGDVVLDEFAFHKDADKIFAATIRQTTLGFSMRVLSTPFGQRGRFYDMARSLKLDLGIRPERQPVKSQTGVWSGHWCDIYLAHDEGFPVDPETVRRACFEAGGDEETWRQEYCCEFISTAAQWISPELWQSCVSSEAISEFRVMSSEFITQNSKLFYAGWDIARKRDFSVIWICELVGDVSWTRGVLTLKNLPTPDQLREARMLLRGDSAAAASPSSIRATPGPLPASRNAPGIRRMAIDMSGMGLAIFEQLAREFPGRVEGVQFTQPTKEAMAVRVKDRMEKRLLRIPDNDEIRQSFMALKRQVTATGLARFDSEHDTHYGHSDHFWACALAEAAAEQPATSLAEFGAVVGEPVVAGMRDRIF